MPALLTDLEAEELSETNQRLRRENAALRREVAGHVRRTEDPIWATLLEVYAETQRQEARYGADNEVALDGTGPDSTIWWPLSTRGAAWVESAFRLNYESRTGSISWAHLVREEVAEAFKESDPARLREELTQVAALCANWASRR
jgi:hypothetical protein